VEKEAGVLRTADAVPMPTTFLPRLDGEPSQTLASVPSGSKKCVRNASWSARSWATGYAAG